MSGAINNLPGGSETILIVDDHETIWDFLIEALQKLGYSVLLAENGLDATWDTLFVCESLADLGLPPEPNPIPTDIHVGKRIGIDYAQEAIDFPWRFYVTEQGEHL